MTGLTTAAAGFPDVVHHITLLLTDTFTSNQLTVSLDVTVIQNCLMFSQSGQDPPQVQDLPIEKEITLLHPRPSVKAFLVIRVHLHYVRPLLLVLFCQVHPDVLAHPGTKRRILQINEVRYYLTSIVHVLSGGTYGLPGGSFISWLPLLTTVSSAATRSAGALLSSLALSADQQVVSPVLLQFADTRRWVACYRWSSGSRIVEARSSSISLKSG